MAEKATSHIPMDFVSEVSLLVKTRLVAVGSRLGMEDLPDRFAGGKMLRTRLAGRLLAACPDQVDRATVALACGAIELTHSASLCHDDVVDNGLMRRGMPALWKSAGSSGAILVGDVLLCEAMDLILEMPDVRYVGAFVSKVKEVVSAEAEQELMLRGRDLDEETCLRLARSKTGPLFGFVGYVCGGDNETLSHAVQESGYRIGTAYQLIDDLIDSAGSEDISGKTLGTDLMRKKFTLSQAGSEGEQRLGELVRQLCESALAGVSTWPEIRNALAMFLNVDLRGVIDQLGVSLNLSDLSERAVI